MNSLPRLILIPGWAHDSAAMEDLRKNLESAADIRPVSFDNLWSAETQMFPPSSCARNLGKMIEKIGGRVFIAGWSLGGMIALETALHWRARVAGLVLISTTPKFCAGQNWIPGVPAGVLQSMISRFKKKPRAVLANFFKNVALPLEEQEGKTALKTERACAMNPLELLSGLEYLLKTDLRNEAIKANIPALVLHGKQDAVIPAEAGLALKNLLPNSGIRVYENCGHGLPWQNAHAVAEDIKGFLEECRKRNIKQIHP